MLKILTPLHSYSVFVWPGIDYDTKAFLFLNTHDLHCNKCAIIMQEILHYYQVSNGCYANAKQRLSGRKD